MPGGNLTDQEAVKILRTHTTLLEATRAAEGGSQPTQHKALLG
jgi:hypothetical protein